MEDRDLLRAHHLEAEVQRHTESIGREFLAGFEVVRAEKVAILHQMAPFCFVAMRPTTIAAASRT